MSFASSGQVEYTGSGTITALNGAVTVLIPTSAAISIKITGTWVATLTFQVSVDGTNWDTFQVLNIGTNATVSTTTANGVFGAAIGGYLQVRIIATAFTSGTVTIAWTADNNPNDSFVPAVVRNSLGTEIFTSGTPGVISGTITASPVDGTKTTYSSAAVNLVSAASATDIFTITGSATKTIRVAKLYVSGLATTGGNITVNFIKRSTANTGGTSSILTAVPFDSTNAAATAVVRSYTANPTLGTAVGTIRSERVFISGGATTASNNSFDVFGDFAQAVVLRGTSEVLAINLNGVTINSPSLNLWVEWVEE